MKSRTTIRRKRRWRVCAFLSGIFVALSLSGAETNAPPPTAGGTNAPPTATH
ncbi:MAG TPA: hypothetical protein VNU68_31150 [Verrucomicrobiae bacterium]|nr:hypothetical protein [Verrucomicrobiae bacterium]